MKIFKKLTIVAIVAACAVCLAFGIAGCAGGEEHVHTFSEDWTQTETEHWHKATCEHTTQKSGYGKHVDEDDNGKCDTCGYELHHTYSELWLPDGENGHYHAATCHDGVRSAAEPHDYDENFKCRVCDYQHDHTFDLSHWEHDESTHWHAADCGHEVKQDETTHADADDDQFCDDCGEFVPHVHVFNETEWLYDINKHWHLSTCHPNDPTVKGNEAEHTFTAGVCVCGVKEIEKQAYGVLVDHEIVVDDFYTWRTGIQADGVTEVSVTEQGDVIYNRSGNIEGVYIADRKVKVKAEDQNKQSVAGVYVKVICAINGVTQKFNDGVTDALAIGVTGADGVAEIEFTPIGGFSSATVLYRVKIPEAKDIEQLLHISENEVRATPIRYLYTDETNTISFNITEDTNETEIGPLKFTYSRGIAAYDPQLNIPYRRYYNNPIKGENIAENKKSLIFNASGNNLYDYITFTPYDVLPEYGAGRYPSDEDTIINNSKEAASGIYRISFTVEGNANVRMYFWNEGGFDPNVSKYLSPDGIPLDTYLTAISGSGEGEKYTGTNSIELTVEQEFATKSFQLAILTDNKCTVTVSVAWLYSVDDVTDYTIDWSNAENDAVTVTQLVLNKYTATKIGLENFEPGLYQISLLNELGAFTKSADKYRIYTNDCKDEEMMLWEYTTLAANTDEYKAVLNFTEATARLFINNRVTAVYADLKIEKYTFPDLGTDPVYLPVTTVTAERYNIPLSSTLNGEYTVSLITCGLTSLCNNLHDIVVYIGDRQYTLTTEDNSTNGGSCVYTGNISIEAGDTNLSLAFAYNAAPIPYSLMAQTTLTKAEAL